MESFISEHLPDGLLALPAERLHEKLDGPKLFHLPGRVKQPLVVSVLQHGNEISGWDAVRHLLGKTYARQTLDRKSVVKGKKKKRGRCSTSDIERKKGGAD